MTVQRFFRPEDISRECGYRAGFWDVYASSENQEIDLDEIIGACHVLPAGSSGGVWLHHLLEHEQPKLHIDCLQNAGMTTGSS